MEGGGFRGREGPPGPHSGPTPFTAVSIAASGPRAARVQPGEEAAVG